MPRMPLYASYIVIFLILPPQIWANIGNSAQLMALEIVASNQISASLILHILEAARAPRIYPTLNYLTPDWFLIFSLSVTRCAELSRLKATSLKDGSFLLCISSNRTRRDSAVSSSTLLYVCIFCVSRLSFPLTTNELGSQTSVIHSVFRTSRTDWNINETSSYVDLGILYGNTQAHQGRHS